MVTEFVHISDIIILGQTLTQNYYVANVNEFGDHCVFTNFKEITVTLNTKDVRYCGSNHSQSKRNLGTVGKYTKWGESETDMILCTGISSLTHNDASINKVSDEKYWDINNAADQSCRISMFYVLGSAFDNSCFIAMNNCSITINFPDGNNLEVSLATGERLVFEVVTGEIHGNESRNSRYYA